MSGCLFSIYLGFGFVFYVVNKFFQQFLWSYLVYFIDELIDLVGLDNWF